MQSRAVTNTTNFKKSEKICLTKIKISLYEIKIRMINEKIRICQNEVLMNNN